MTNEKRIIHYVRKNHTLDIRCKTCDSIVLKENKKDEPYYCPKCNKYLWEIYTIKSYRNMTVDECFEILDELTKKENLE